LASATTRRVGIGIAVGVVALCILGAITEDVVNNDPLVRFDVSVLETLHRHSTPTGVALFSLISRFGSATVLTILALSGVLFLAVRREWIVLGGWVAAFAGALRARTAAEANAPNCRRVMRIVLIRFLPMQRVPQSLCQNSVQNAANRPNQRTRPCDNIS